MASRSTVIARRGDSAPKARAAALKAGVDGKVKSPDVSETQPAAAYVYQEVKRRILANQLHPGNKLTHQGLAELLNVSRTPVRESLERLCQEGFAVHVPRRGYFVAEIDEQEARELHEMREALEVFALRKSMAGGGLSKQSLDNLQEINLRYRQAVEESGNKRRMLIDREFHLALAAYAGNSYLHRALESIFERIILKLRVDGYNPDQGLVAFEEHEALLSSLRKGQLAQAEQLLSQHVRAAYARLLQQIEVNTAVGLA